MEGLFEAHAEVERLFEPFFGRPMNEAVEAEIALELEYYLREHGFEPESSGLLGLIRETYEKVFDITVQCVERNCVGGAYTITVKYSGQDGGDGGVGRVCLAHSSGLGAPHTVPDGLHGDV